MHRSIGRAIRGTCRKWRENECPVAAGEEVRKSKDGENRKEFDPPKHCWEEAVTWTAGLVLGYQLTNQHRRRRRRPLVEENSLKESCLNPKPKNSGFSKSCPFAVSSRVFTQPIINSHSALNVKSKSTSAVVPSIDVTPFIHEECEFELPDTVRERLNSISEEDEEDIVFSSDPFPSDNKSSDTFNEKISTSTLSASSSMSSLMDNPVEYGRRFSGDILGVVGAFEYLKEETNAKNISSESKAGKKLRKKQDSKKYGVFGKNPPIHALDLMKKGAELGSGRSLYNLGVAYDRMMDQKLAKEYYKRAADLGHPLAVYNCAVLALKEGRLAEGYSLMKTASESGVPEADRFLNPPPDDTLNSQLRNLQVGNA